MRVIFTGVGEAFDERLANCSVLVHGHGGMVLLDCGFTAPFAFWRCALDAGMDPRDLDAVWISHLHGDHFLGLPALLLRLIEEGRSRPLPVVGPGGTAWAVATAAGLAYDSVGRVARDGEPFALDFHEVQPGHRLELAGLTWRFAAGDHVGDALALRLDGPAGPSGAAPSLFYSGDGRPTQATRALALGCGLIVHEAYALDGDVPGHGTVTGALDFARSSGAQALALVHINRRDRHQRRTDIQRLAASPDALLTLIPEPGDAMDVPPANLP